jgi:hypothetical protein
MNGERKELSEEVNTFILLMMMSKGVGCSGCQDNKKSCKYKRVLV